MKKSRNDLIQLAILAGLGLSVICSLVIPQAADDRHSEPPPELSVIVREPESALWFNTRMGMEQAAGDLGADLRYLPVANLNSSEEQRGLIRREASGGSDVFVIAPADPVGLSPVLGELTDNRPVVALESRMESAADTVGLDNSAVGEALARAVLKDWTGGSVLLLNTAEHCTAVTDRLNAARAVLEKAGVPLVIHSTRSDHIPRFLAQLTDPEQISCIVAFEHSATEQIAACKESTGLDVLLYGAGASGSIAAYLERDVLRASAAWSDYAAGYLCVSQAVGLYREDVVLPCDPIPFFIVYGEDIYDPDMQKLLFPVAP